MPEALPTAGSVASSLGETSGKICFHLIGLGDRIRPAYFFSPSSAYLGNVRARGVVFVQ
jgi:hypothetical protein